MNDSKITRGHVTDIAKRLQKIASYANVRDVSDLYNSNELGEDFVDLSLPGEEEYITLSIDEFYKITEDLDIKHDWLTFRNSHITQKLLDADYHYFDTGLFDKVYEEDDYTIQFTNQPMLIGITNLKEGNYTDYVAPCSRHVALEIEYKNGRTLSSEEEEVLLDNVLLDYNKKYGDIFPVQFDDMRDARADDNEYGELCEIGSEEINETNELVDVEQSTESWKIFQKAQSSNNVEYRIVEFNKLIEYIHEITKSSLTKIKESPEMTNQLTWNKTMIDKFKTKFKSEHANNLINAYLDSSDIVQLFTHMPTYMKELIAKNLGCSDLTRLSLIDVTKNFERIKNEISKCVYRTRCALAHGGKRNCIYICPNDEFTDLSLFMSALCKKILAKGNFKLISEIDKNKQ